MSKGYDTKQVLVVRKDLQMRRGKTAAQCCHASLGVFFEMAQWTDSDCLEIANIPIHMIEWIKGSFAKIVVYVNSEAELDQIHEQAKSAGIPTCLITDSGHTEFHMVPTKTVCAIGPWDSVEIDKITGALPLL